MEQSLFDSRNIIQDDIHLSYKDQSDESDLSHLVGQEFVEAIQKAMEPLLVKHYRTTKVFLAIRSKQGKREVLTINVYAS